MTFVPYLRGDTPLPYWEQHSVLEIFGERLCLWYYRKHVKNENARYGIPESKWSEEKAHYQHSCYSCYDRIVTAASPRVYADWDSTPARSGVDFF